MRHLFILIVFFCSNLFCNNINSGTSISNNNTTFFRLVGNPERYTSCGTIKNYVGFKFKDLKDNSIVVILILCPELYGKDFFEIGKDYEIEMLKKEDKLDNAALTNEFIAESLKTNFAKDIRHKN